MHVVCYWILFSIANWAFLRSCSRNIYPLQQEQHCSQHLGLQLMTGLRRTLRACWNCGGLSHILAIYSWLTDYCFDISLKIERSPTYVVIPLTKLHNILKSCMALFIRFIWFFLKLSSLVSITGTDGKPLKSQEEQVERWKEHFQTVPNCAEPDILHDCSGESANDFFEINSTAITKEEVLKVMKKLKNLKNLNFTVDGILAELQKHGGYELARREVSECLQSYIG